MVSNCGSLCDYRMRRLFQEPLFSWLLVGFYTLLHFEERTPEIRSMILRSFSPGVAAACLPFRDRYDGIDSEFSESRKQEDWR